MSKFKKSQVLILSLIVVLLSLTPFLSTSIRSAHLYIVINILILTVGVESGLLSAFPKPQAQAAATISVPKNGLDSTTNVITTTKIVTPLVKKSNMEKKMSTPSIFFISCGEIEPEEEDEDEVCAGVGDAAIADEQELSAKADNFISNFYKQLKMQQRMES